MEEAPGEAGFLGGGVGDEGEQEGGVLDVDGDAEADAAHCEHGVG